MQSLFPVTEDRTKYLAGCRLGLADNVDVLKVLPNSSIDLIYLDPAFRIRTMSQSLAIRARWTTTQGYLEVDDGDGADLSEAFRPCA